MKKPNILVTIPQNNIFNTFFNDELINRLETVGNVKWNKLERNYSKEELKNELQKINIAITGWGTPCFDENVMENAADLKLIAHTGGSVNGYVTKDTYDKGVRVISGNAVFAESVAEGVIAYALAALRKIPHYSAKLSEGDWPGEFLNRGLLERSVGIVGYGMIARFTVQKLSVFRCPVKVFSRHINEAELQKYNMQKADLSEIFSTCDIISIHSGMTPENYHLIDETLLRSMKQNALLINTARGAIIDEAALCEVLKQRSDLYAALDVYEVEPLPKDNKLLSLNNVLLMPHQGGPTIDRRLAVTKSVISDVICFLNGKEMSCEISASYSSKMSAF